MIVLSNFNECLQHGLQIILIYGLCAEFLSVFIPFWLPRIDELGMLYGFDTCLFLVFWMQGKYLLLENKTEEALSAFCKVRDPALNIYLNIIFKMIFNVRLK